MPRVSTPPLGKSLRALCLPTFATHHAAQAAVATAEGWSFDRYLHSLCELELGQREQRRKQRLLAASKLPREKTMAAFDRGRLKKTAERQVAALLDGAFLDRAENVLAFGNPGSGKSHLLSAIGHELIDRGRTVAFTTCVLLVQRLLLSKNQLWLEKELKRLDRFEALIIDDIGYVQQSREEMEVLFTLLAHRYERRSVLLTSNLVFSDWERIFKVAGRNAEPLRPITAVTMRDRWGSHARMRSFAVDVLLPEPSTGPRQ